MICGYLWLQLEMISSDFVPLLYSLHPHSSPTALHRTDIFVFLLSTRAGGLGINLTAADTVSPLLIPYHSLNSTNIY